MSEEFYVLIFHKFQPDNDLFSKLRIQSKPALQTPGDSISTTS